MGGEKKRTSNDEAIDLGDKTFKWYIERRTRKMDRWLEREGEGRREGRERKSQILPLSIHRHNFSLSCDPEVRRVTTKRESRSLIWPRVLPTAAMFFEKIATISGKRCL